MLEKLKDLLSGKKTYLIGLGAILTALVAYSSGDLSIVQLVQSIVAAVMAMTIRAGVTKSNPEA